MGVGTFIHYFGTFFLLVATALLIVASISAPVVNHISLLNADIGGMYDIRYGSFGWCIRNSDSGDEACSNSHIGYNTLIPLQQLGSSDIDMSNIRGNTINGLTNVMILHPVAAGLCFVAFLLALGTNMIGSFIASMISALAFIVTLVAMVCDFVAFSLLRNRIRDADLRNTTAHYGSAMWCILAAAILTLLATIIIFITCCAGRRKAKRNSTKVEPETWNGTAQPTTYPRTRRHFWQRR